MTAPDAMRAKYLIDERWKSSDGYQRGGIRWDTDAMLRDLTRLTQIETAARAYIGLHDLMLSFSTATTGRSLAQLHEMLDKRSDARDALRDTLTPAGGAKDE